MKTRILLGISLVVLIALVLQTSGNLLKRRDDTLAYWSAARLNLQGCNPYDPERLMALQHSNVEETHENVLFFFDLPYELSILAVIGIFPFPFARMVWLMLSLILFILASEWIWVVYAGYDRRWIAWVVTALFLPVALTLRMGQNGAFIVLGAALFLLGLKDERPWLAGLGIALMIVKPNLYWMLWPALLFWKMSGVAIRAVVWVAVFSTAAVLMNPELPFQFIESFGQQPFWAAQTLGGLFRLAGSLLTGTAIGSRFSWIQFLPIIPGMLWFSFWYLDRHQFDTWQEILPDLILASLVFAPYGHTHSLAALLPVVIQTVATCDRQFRSLLSLIPIVVPVALHNSYPGSVMIIAMSIACWRWLNLRKERSNDRICCVCN